MNARVVGVTQWPRLLAGSDPQRYTDTSISASSWQHGGRELDDDVVLWLSIHVEFDRTKYRLETIDAAGLRNREFNCHAWP